jgi:hypothetical protein
VIKPHRARQHIRQRYRYLLSIDIPAPKWVQMRQLIALNFAYSGLVMALEVSWKQNRFPGLTS